MSTYSLVKFLYFVSLLTLYLCASGIDPDQVDFEHLYDYCIDESSGLAYPCSTLIARYEDSNYTMKMDMECEQRFSYSDVYDPNNWHVHLSQHFDPQNLVETIGTHRLFYIPVTRKYKQFFYISRIHWQTIFAHRKQMWSTKNRNDVDYIINIYQDGVFYDYNDPLGTSHKIAASAYIIKGEGDDGVINNPVIFVDGLDTYNEISIIEILTSDKYGSAFSRQPGNLLGEGYDLIFVDFADGGGDITKNAKALLRFIEFLNDRGKCGPITLCGFSMGGVVSRLALLYGEKCIPNKISKVKKFISIDSPQQGATVINDLQKALWHIFIPPRSIADQEVARKGLFIRALGGLAFSRAAFQMLYKIYFNTPCWDTYRSTTSYHREFYNFLKHMGDYPSSKILKYSIADAHWAKPYPQGADPGVLAATLNSHQIRLNEYDLAPGSYIDLLGDEDNPIQIIFPLPTGIFISLGTIGLDLKPAPPNPHNNYYFKPTHIPLYSVFDIRNINFYDITPPSNQSDLNKIAFKYSPFDKIYIVNHHKRYEHITVDDPYFSQAFLQALNDHDRARPDITPIINLLLDN